MVLSFNSFTCSIFCLFFSLLLHMLTYSKEKLVSRKKSKKKLTKYQKRNGSPTDSPKNRVTLEELNASSSHDLVPLEEVMNLLEAETEEVKNIIVIKIHRLKAWFTFAVDLPKIPTWRLELKMRNTFSATSASSDITVDILRPKAFEETSKLHQPCTKPQLLRSFQINET